MIGKKCLVRLLPVTILSERTSDASTRTMTLWLAHSIATFPNGTTDAVMYVGILKDGKLFRTETGSTPINK